MRDSEALTADRLMNEPSQSRRKEARGDRKWREEGLRMAGGDVVLANPQQRELLSVLQEQQPPLSSPPPTPPLFCSGTNERVCQVLIMKRDVRGESGQRGTVPWISCCALI